MRRRDAELRALALTGLYQLTFLRVPEHAAVSATVDAADILRRGNAKGFLNAILRRYQREQDTLRARLPTAARHAHPEWLWSDLCTAYPQHFEEIAAANNQRPPMTLRVNLARQSRDTYLQLLKDAGLHAHPADLCASAVTLETPIDVNELPGFNEGRCSVQDETAQLAASFLEPRTGERILDACAAPGGKTGHILETAADIEVTAMDSDPGRLGRVGDNLSRLHLDADLICGDAASPPDGLGTAFDAILVDAPCSATGVIRRHPDIKVLRRPADIAGFQSQQAAILEGLWPRLRDGGRLLYVTCSVLPQENAVVIDAFLRAHPDAGEEPLDHPQALPEKHGLQFLPRTGGGDGLYYCLLRKHGTT
jgi:16S rRNA (cytosine967-C5)-methyltransferase